MPTRISVTCPTCGKAFNRTLKQVNVVVKRSGRWRCQACMMRARNTANAKPIGSTRRTNKGYIVEKTEAGWVMQHVVVMERHLGRKIRVGIEAVHHINEIKTDNRLDNLELKPFGEHTREHHLGTKRSPQACANIRRGILKARQIRGEQSHVF